MIVMAGIVVIVLGSFLAWALWPQPWIEVHRGVLIEREVDVPRYHTTYTFADGTEVVWENLIGYRATQEPKASMIGREVVVEGKTGGASRLRFRIIEEE